MESDEDVFISGDEADSDKDLIDEPLNEIDIANQVSNQTEGVWHNQERWTFEAQRCHLPQPMVTPAPGLKPGIFSNACYHAEENHPIR